MILDDAGIKLKMVELENLIGGDHGRKQLCLQLDCMFMCLDLHQFCPQESFIFNPVSRFQTVFL
jgi:hypothetical protein